MQFFYPRPLNSYISPIWVKAPTAMIETETCMVSNIPDQSRVQSFKMKFSRVTILQGIKFPIFLLIFASALQQCRKHYKTRLWVTDCHLIWSTAYKHQCTTFWYTNLHIAAIFISISSPVEESFDWQVNLMKPRLLSTAGQRHQTVCELRTSLFKVLGEVEDDLSTIVGRTLTPAVTHNIIMT